MKPEITLVTGLWDLGRSNLDVDWARSFEEHYIKHFENLLEVPFNLIIFAEEELEDLVWSKRSKENTIFISRSKTWFRNEFYDTIQNIRNDENWKNQTNWLPNSTQSRLELYNPVVMSKMFLLNDAAHFDCFDSTHLFWVDAGLTSTVNLSLLSDNDNLKYFCSNLDKFFFISYFF